MNQKLSLSKSVIASLVVRQQTQQWESFVVSMLKRLELDASELARAKAHYDILAQQLARKLDIADTDVHIVVQGSMRTQTTISPRGNAKFDLDIVVKLTGGLFDGTDSETFFARFGEALTGLNDSAGEPKPKPRCWRLEYTGEPFYFDVTPALPGSQLITGTDLRVRDPKTKWSPSNPEEFADWFCHIADLRFGFERRVMKGFALDHAQIDPIPSAPVEIDDVLRRTVQLIKLHRDNYYYGASISRERKEAKPISVILVTLATHAYQDLWMKDKSAFASPIELVLEIVDQLPHRIERANGKFRVANPALTRENFAERWNEDGGLRAKEFQSWHTQLTGDLELLFNEDYDSKSEQRIRSVFGQHGVDSWKASRATPAAGVLAGLRATAPAQPRSNPSSPMPVGSKNTLA
ncbi:nucleotidyltransferase [Cupriavidus sp. amp6]|uniref:nucleotidyltransferase domain-containing protein n=1 Tax=Cupriavidus sp. amp6 TaxID=388051 RepID=UPI00048DA6BA|nr:nucleotidyltransferase [Cupriavidus sp. amp6]